jgi:hypothetical protein
VQYGSSQLQQQGALLWDPESTTDRACMLHMLLHKVYSVPLMHACMRTLVAAAYQVLDLLSKAAVHGLQTYMFCFPDGSQQRSQLAEAGPVKLLDHHAARQAECRWLTSAIAILHCRLSNFCSPTCMHAILPQVPQMHCHIVVLRNLMISRIANGCTPSLRQPHRPALSCLTCVSCALRSASSA